MSLAEVMVTVAILGVLATLARPSFQLMADRSKIGRAKADMNGIRAAAMGLRVGVDAALRIAMGTPSTAAYFQGRNTHSKPVCTNPLNATAQFQKLSFDTPPMDAWGQCYLLDENEGEYGSSDCRFDAIISGGPDEIWRGAGDGDDVYSDDLIMRVPYYYEHPACSGNIDGQFGG